MTKRHDPSCSVWTGRRACDCVTSATRPGALVRTRRAVLDSRTGQIIERARLGVIVGTDGTCASVEFNESRSEYLWTYVKYEDLERVAS